MDLQNVCKPAPWFGDLTASAITVRGGGGGMYNSRYLTRRTEGRTIRNVMGGVGKKNHSREGD